MMPVWAKDLLHYGPLGIFMFAVLVVAIPAIWQQLFSRNEKRLGLVVLLVRSAMKKNDKMSEFIDAMLVHETSRQQLCEQHATGILQVSANTSETCHEVLRLKTMARESVHLARELLTGDPPDKQRVADHLASMERAIDQPHGA
jgi:hypothetical protein